MKQQFVTKDSGKRVVHSTGMQRDTQEGKPRYDLILPKGNPEPMLKRWAELLARGAVKYSERNWELAETNEELARAEASLSRHFVQYMMGETDEDHAAAILFNIQEIENIKWKQSRK